MQKAIMDRIFVKLDEPEKKAIIMETKKREYARRGIVQSVGERVKSVQVGDHVIFEQWDVDVDEINGLVAIREKMLLGVITDD